MEDLLRALWAVVNAVFGPTGDRRRKAAQALREALGARVPGPRQASPPAAPPARVPGQRTDRVAESRRGEGQSLVEPAKPSREGNVPATTAESSLVRSLFAGPQSLAAAFIAAEILAKPVALREH